MIFRYIRKGLAPRINIKSSQTFAAKLEGVDSTPVDVAVHDTLIKYISILRNKKMQKIPTKKKNTVAYLF